MYLFKRDSPFSDTSEVYATHTPHIVHDQGYPFPPEGFPYIGSIPIGVYPKLPHDYVSLAQLVMGTHSALSLYHNPISLSSAMITSGPFIQNLSSQLMVPFVVTSVLVKPTILNPVALSVQVTHMIQLTITSQVSLSSLIPTVSGWAVPPPRGKT